VFGMGSPTELAKSWDRLDADEMDCIELLSSTVSQVSQPMADFLRRALTDESGHRESLKVKSRQIPEFDAWTDADVADGYMAAVMIQTACNASQRLKEWADLLIGTVCCEMAARLQMRHSYTEVMGQ